ncbi:hypothetical protein HCU01_03820 [Halomonas cupida]|uniref:Transposase n=1 Tax=Halomonas cupida TaxID=44933 RepID=A0A1M7AD26_9GAMM|nr:hypothetical protein HCU01_03820 [Halomonas cupida]SHL40643.1 Protein of unknown function [Halomonas cupida]
MNEEPTVKRWTARRKAAVVTDIFKGKTTVAEVARQHNLAVSEEDSWIDEAQRNMGNGFWTRPGISGSSTRPSYGGPGRHWARPTCRSAR